MLSIKTNMMAANAARHLGINYDALSQSVERLSSGKRINSAKDDAAGMAVSEGIRADVATLQQGSRNAQDAISMLQTAEGAMGVIDDNLVRMKELAEQASTGSYSGDQKDIMNQEFQQLSQEITRIAQSTTFNGISLLDDTTTRDINVGSSQTIDVSGAVMDAAALGLSATKSYGTNTATVADPNDTNFATTADGDNVTFQFGSQAAFTVNWSTGSGNTGARSMNQIVSDINTAAGYTAAAAVYDSNTGTYSLKLTAQNGGADALTVTGTQIPAALADATWAKTTGSASGLNIGSTGDASAALAGVAAAITQKDTYRSMLGYMMNRLSSAQQVVDIQAENLQTADSRISDVDVATEMATMTQSNVLAQAGISMLAQANQMPQMALTLLRG